MGSTPYAANAATFLIQTLFGLYILAVLLRFLLQWVRADFYNPVSQFLVKVTNPVLVPLRRFIPGYAGIDVAAVVLMLLLKAVELTLVFWLRGLGPAPGGLLLMAVAELLRLAIHVYIATILVQVILSWVSPGTYNPVTGLLYRLNEPLLGRARRLLPPMGGLDLSPILVIIVLQLVSMLLVQPLSDMGTGLMLR